MRKIMIAMMVMMWMFPLGCSTVIPLGADVCDTLLGGSRLGGLCDQIEDVVTGEEVAPPVE